MATQQDNILSVEGISKMFSMADNKEDNFKEAIVSTLINLVKGGIAKKKNDFWALKDISFELKRGESLGIIGSNGAGKSSLLKILSNITEPSTGQIDINGRMVSILEIGTGFHPDLTGAENIFLNGGLMGMTESEIKDEYFERIVEFSGVEDFIHTPIKHYSSGMYVRLAFAVAAHLNADLLILDEVLSVGDAEFRVKAKNKIKSLIQAGTSLLFVTHNMGEVLDLCDNCIWMERGRIRMTGASELVVKKYSEYALLNEKVEVDADIRQAIKITAKVPRLIKQQILFPELQFDNANDAPGDDLVKLLHASVKANNKLLGQNIYIGNDILVQMTIEILKDLDNPIFFGFIVIDSSGNRLFVTSTHSQFKEPLLLQCKGTYNFTCHLKGPLLPDGIFSISFGYHSPPVPRKVFEHSEIYFRVEDTGTTSFSGLICPPVLWSVEN